MRRRWRVMFERVCAAGFLGGLALVLSWLWPPSGRLYVIAFAVGSYAVAWLLFGDRLSGPDGGKLYLLAAILIVLAAVLVIPVCYVLRRRRQATPKR